jgi:hypothetical protein
MVIDEINKEPSLTISFPDTHIKQTTIANGFNKKSQPRFSNCCGAVDGVLVWIHKPSKTDAKLTKCGETKKFCGRKKIWFKHAGCL